MFRIIFVYSLFLLHSLVSMLYIFLRTLSDRSLLSLYASFHLQLEMKETESLRERSDNSIFISGVLFITRISWQGGKKMILQLTIVILSTLAQSTIEFHPVTHFNNQVQSMLCCTCTFMIITKIPNGALLFSPPKLLFAAYCHNI